MQRYLNTSQNFNVKVPSSISQWGTLSPLSPNIFPLFPIKMILISLPLTFLTPFLSLILLHAPHQLPQLPFHPPIRQNNCPALKHFKINPISIPIFKLLLATKLQKFISEQNSCEKEMINLYLLLARSQ